MFGSIWPPFSQTVIIEKLTDDFLNSTGESSYIIQQGGDFPVTATSPNLIDGQVESPDLFKRGDWWCKGSSNSESKSWNGPWTFQFVESDDSTCGGQAMGVMAIPLMGLRVGGGTIGHSFWALTFEDDNSIGKIDCSPDASTSVVAPLSMKDIATTGSATNATDGSGNHKHYWAETNYPSTLLYQTWTSSRTGNLSTIAINLAVNSESPALTVYTFRYENEEQLLAPWFEWELLGYSKLTTENITQSLNVVKISVSAQVAKGDRIGFALTIGHPLKLGLSMPLGGSPFPWSYLVTDNTGVETDHKLYVGVRDRVSYREGMKSPVERWGNHELKWYAEIL
ncbi:unnamed protein product [Penicillium bialowiezense]